MKLIFDIGKVGRRGTSLPKFDVENKNSIPKNLKRSNQAELPEVTEQDAIRHFTLLSRQNMGVDTNFYPLGSCTMKYNPKFHEKIVGFSGFSDLHPLLPQLRHGCALTQGALAVIYESERILSDLLGFEQFTMQPLAGSHGELTGVMLIAAYHKERNDVNRNVMLIPDSAHGTNPSSAAVAGFTTKEIPSDKNGDVDINALENLLGPEIAGIMLTCPSTLGLFDENVVKINKMVHDAGGLSYCDGANLNAIMGKVRPGDLGFDVMHINLHKTFATPHGGGGPGSGPVGVANTLVPYLPISQVKKREDGTYTLNYNEKKSIGYIAPFYGNFGVILKAYAYMLTLGKEGFKRVSENAVINANYIRAKLAKYYDQKYDRECMHECVFAGTRYLKNNVHTIDIAKALIDRGIHPPTIYFPLIVEESIMIEPTETESKETIDNFINIMIEIANLAENNPDEIIKCPVTTPVKRLDETMAARKPDIASINKKYN